MPLEIVPRLLEDQEHELLLAFFGEKMRQTEPAYLMRLPRVGFSGAKLFLVTFSSGGTALPFVVKVHSEPKIREEWEALRSVSVHFSDLRGASEPYCRNGLGAICYPHMGAMTLEKALEDRLLAEVAYSPKFPQDKLESILKGVFASGCLSAHNHCPRTLKSRSMSAEYRDYLRANRDPQRNPTHRIRAMFGADAKARRLQFFGAKIFNPTILIKERFRTPQRLRRSVIHGDLHPYNIVIDDRDQPHLIDFAWADTQAHFLKDYVLLENSLRFKHFPPYADPAIRQQADQLLLDQDGYQKVAALPPRRDICRDAYVRLASMIGEIRKAARRVDTGLDFRDYLAAQFLVLYGLMSYDDYFGPATVRALGVLATRLEPWLK